MKAKLFVGLFMILLLIGCNEETNTAPQKNSEQEILGNKEQELSENKEHIISLGEEFTYNKRLGRDGNVKATLKVMVDNVRLVDGDDERYDYIAMDLSVENIGDKEANFLSLNQCRIYDGNGKEIVPLAFQPNSEYDTYSPADLRPGGKNVGTDVIAVNKGTGADNIKEILFSENDGDFPGDKFVVNVK
ncbi:hypothetical protein [Cytobacillus gottheilii]|uniref:hypothetical protein n=1 Tax=Cytobacillus gottheilii TaxID=859144 RepID=UPI00083366C0|nr:hypothetical protein [Cytobacillus gottheilii]